MRAPDRFYLAYAPAGQWNSGPSVIPAIDIASDLVQSLRDSGWTVEGPFAKVGTRDTGESRRSFRDRINGGWHKD